jgi:hypothetical protein
MQVTTTATITRYTNIHGDKFWLVQTGKRELWFRDHGKDPCGTKH